MNPILTSLLTSGLQPLAIKKKKSKLFSHLKPIRKSVPCNNHEVNIWNNITRWLCSFTCMVNSLSKYAISAKYFHYHYMLCRSEQTALKSICKSLANRLISKPVKYNIQPIYFCLHLFRKYSFKEWKLGLLVQYQVLSILSYTLFRRMKKRKYI